MNNFVHMYFHIVGSVSSGLIPRREIVRSIGKYMCGSVVYVLVKSHQSCPALYDSVDCSPPGSTVHGIAQARILEWVAISFSRESSRPRDRTQGLNPGLLHWQVDSLPLSHQRSPTLCLYAHTIPPSNPADWRKGIYFIHYCIPAPRTGTVSPAPTVFLRRSVETCE